MRLFGFSIVNNAQLDRIEQKVNTIDTNLKKLTDFALEDQKVRIMTHQVKEAKNRIPPEQ